MIERLDQAVAGDARRVIVVAPTGAGKTILAAEIIKRATTEALSLIKPAIVAFAHGDDGAFRSLPINLEILFARHFAAVEQESHADRSASIDVATNQHAVKGSQIMDVSKYLKRGFIKLEHVERGPLFERIEDVAPGNYEKLVVTFSSGAKLSLNQTNLGVLCNELGMNDREWLGADVKLFKGEVPTNNGPAPSVLLEVLAPDDSEPAPTSNPKALANEIPFGEDDNAFRR